MLRAARVSRMLGSAGGRQSLWAAMARERRATTGVRNSGGAAAAAQEETAGAQLQLVRERLEVEGKSKAVRFQVSAALVEREEEAPAQRWDVGYFETPVVNLRREMTTTTKLDEGVFGAPIRPDVVHTVLLQRLAAMRNVHGVKPSLRRSEKAASTRKVRPQKGSGRSRQGGVVAPHMRGGAKAHGRKQRDLRFKVPVKVKKLAMRSALSAKYAAGKLVVLDGTELDSHKTKLFAETLEKSNWPKTSMLIIDSPVPSPNLRLAAANIPRVSCIGAVRMNIWDLLRKDLLLVTRPALDDFVRLYSEK
mmetsp:Transcript_8460/g.35345  ORF Transcript_8460/g.35345 Transcript_8460/m.35345 type:complete len:306 (+) Transcript_8460:40-957(+)